MLNDKSNIETIVLQLYTHHVNHISHHNSHTAICCYGIMPANHGSNQMRIL